MGKKLIRHHWRCLAACGCVRTIMKGGICNSMMQHFHAHGFCIHARTSFHSLFIVAYVENMGRIARASVIRKRDKRHESSLRPQILEHIRPSPPSHGAGTSGLKLPWMAKHPTIDSANGNVLNGQTCGRRAVKCSHLSTDKRRPS